MAELLVNARAHWMDALTAAEVKKFTPDELAGYNARSQIGDIVVVKPDGWQWGREECLPRYVVVKLPGIAEKDAKKYEEGLWDATDTTKPPILLKRRKHQVPPLVVQNYVAAKTSAVTVAAVGQTAFKSAIIVKTS